MIKAIIFDIDDTLIKTFETKKEALKVMGKKYYGTELRDEQIKAVWGKPIRELLQILFTDLHDVEEAFERYVVEREKYPTEAYDDTLPVLQELQKKYLLGLISSKSIRYLHIDLKIAGIEEELFFIIQTEEDTKVHKPDPHVFDFALNKLKKEDIKNSEILYVGDRVTDYKAAKDAGLHFYGIAGRTTCKDEFEKNGASTIKDLRELLKLID